MARYYKSRECGEPFCSEHMDGDLPCPLRFEKEFMAKVNKSIEDTRIADALRKFVAERRPGVYADEALFMIMDLEAILKGEE